MTYPPHHRPFYFTVDGMAADTFMLQRCQSQSLQLSHPYCFEVMVLTKTLLDPHRVLGQSAQLQLAGIAYAGLITQCSFKTITLSRHYLYALQLSSYLWPLSQQHNSAIFIDKTVIEIAQDIFDRTAWHGAAVQFNINRRTVAQPLTVQLNESDLTFIERLFSHAGLCYVFNQHADHAPLIVTDDLATLALPPQTIAYCPPSGQVSGQPVIYRWWEKCQLRVQQIHLIGSQAHHPASVIMARATSRSPVRAYGTHDLADVPLLSAAAGNALARVRMQANDCQRRLFYAQTDCAALQLGQRITLTHHPQQTYNDTYYIIGLQLNAEQPGDGEQPQPHDSTGYQAQLTLLKADQPFRTALKPLRKVWHPLPAVVVGDQQDGAAVDDAGCYRIRFPFAAHPLSAPLLQPYAGPSAATSHHFPLYAGTQVMVGFIQGNVQQPVIIGVLSHRAQPLPVTAANPSQHVLNTVSGNQLLFDDAASQRQLCLSTRAPRNHITLIAHAALQAIQVVSTHGDVRYFAAKRYSKVSGGDLQMRSGLDHQLRVGQHYRLTTLRQGICWRSGAAVRFIAGAHSVWCSGQKNITLHSGHTLSLTSVGDVSAVAHDQAMHIHAARGMIIIKAGQQLLLQAKQHLDIGGVIDFVGTDQLHLQADRIYLHAAEIHMVGAITTAE